MESDIIDLQRFLLLSVQYGHHQSLNTLYQYGNEPTVSNLYLVEGKGGLFLLGLFPANQWSPFPRIRPVIGCKRARDKNSSFALSENS